MIDLDKLDRDIDKLLERETSTTLTKWLLSKRLGNINILLGEGCFVSMSVQKQSLFSNKSGAVFNNVNSYSEGNPINRQAA